MLINLMFVGEGKLIVIIGLGDVLIKIGKLMMIVLWEFLLGLVMGMKGGVIGGGYL